MGCSPWGPKESDTTERLTFSFQEFGYVRKRAILSLIYDSLGREGDEDEGDKTEMNGFSVSSFSSWGSRRWEQQHQNRT